MPDATLRNFEELVTRVFTPWAHPKVMPAPRWGQEAAMLGKLIDDLREENDRALTLAAKLATTCFNEKEGGFHDLGAWLDCGELDEWEYRFIEGALGE